MSDKNKTARGPNRKLAVRHLGQPEVARNYVHTQCYAHFIYTYLLWLEKKKWY